jgi:PAS domain S-box-containing protein
MPEPIDRGGRSADGRRKIVPPAAFGEELLALAEEAADLGIFEGDLRNGTVELSSHCLSLYGLTSFDGRYETWLTCIHAEDRPRVSTEMERALAARESRLDTEFRIIRPSDGAVRWLESRRLLFYDDKGRPSRLFGVGLDVTERKQRAAEQRAFTDALEEAVRARTRELESQHEARLEAEKQLRQAQKLEVMGQLMGGVAHDFNNLLTIVMGGVDLIEEKQDPALRKRMLDGIRQAAKRGATLVRQLLSFSRRQSLRPEPIDMADLISEMSELLDRTLRADVKVRRELATDLWPVEVDRSELELAILNLAVNARDAMPCGGTIVVRGENVSELREQDLSGEFVRLSIIDEGTGIPEEIRERVFEPYFTTKEIGGGSGLGLAQVYGFTQQSGGTVQIASEVGSGTTVVLLLPRSQTKPRKEVPIAVEPHRTVEQAQTALLVEDDPQLAVLIEAMLEDLGYSVTCAEDVASALAVKDPTAFDVVVSDIMMPGPRNGLDLAHELRLRRSDLPILLTTGYAEVANAVAKDSFPILRKPFRLDDLSAALERVARFRPESADSAA